MKTFLYIYSKFLKKAKGVAIRNSNIHRSSKIEPGSLVYNSQFDKHSFCGYDCEIVSCDVGSFVSIANEVQIGLSRHPIDWASTSPAFYAGKDSIKAKFSEHSRPSPRRVTIGHDVWIGARAIVAQGVSIGTGAVIGMGSIVTKDVPPYSLVAGVPAKVIRMRFEQEVIDRLLVSEWWLLSDSELAVVAKYVKQPLLFLKAIEK